jgi:hypothetical protein
MRTRAAMLLACLLATVAIACSSPSSSSADDGGTQSRCVSARSCPANVPSYKTTIAPILQTTCVGGCHTQMGTAARFPEDTYAEVYSERGAILSQVAVCQMPPLNGPVMSDAQRVALTGWLECGAPGN